MTESKAEELFRNAFSQYQFYRMQDALAANDQSAARSIAIERESVVATAKALECEEKKKDGAATITICNISYVPSPGKDHATVLAAYTKPENGEWVFLETRAITK